MARRAGPEPGGKIWFIGGPLDNRLEIVWPWLKTLSVAMPDAYYDACCIGDEELPDRPPFAFYRLERLCSPDSAIFDCYVHESVTHEQLVLRVYLSSATDFPFVIHDFEIDNRLGSPGKSAHQKKVR